MLNTTDPVSILSIDGIRAIALDDLKSMTQADVGQLLADEALLDAIKIEAGRSVTGNGVVHPVNLLQLWAEVVFLTPMRIYARWM